MRGKTEVLVETTLLIIRVFSFRTTKTKVSSLLVPYSLPSLFIPTTLSSLHSHINPCFAVFHLSSLSHPYSYHAISPF